MKTSHKDDVQPDDNADIGDYVLLWSNECLL